MQPGPGASVRLVYVADPMCSWCYGFARPLGALLAESPQPLTLVMGGLRPYTKQPLGAAKARELLGHWRQVAEASGQPFAPEPHPALQAPGFVYDTEPAARAVVAVRTRMPGRALGAMHALQRAFYAEGRDITRIDVLIDVLVTALGLGRDEFARSLASPDARRATAADFAQAQAWGIRGYPALLAEHEGGGLQMLASGYTPLDTLRERLQRLATPAG